MGRKKIETDKKKNKLSIAISAKNYNQFDDLDITNKSRLIEQLLREYFESKIK